MEFVAHSFGAMVASVVIFGFTLVVKAFKNSESYKDYLNNPAELISPAIITVLTILTITLAARQLRMKKTLSSFGIRIFSQHDDPETKKADWEGIVGDIQHASRRQSPLWILGATGKETFADSDSPLHKVLKQYEGKIFVMLICPKSQAFEKRIRDLECSNDYYLMQILDSIDYCKELYLKHGRSIEVKLYKAMSVWKMIATNHVLWIQYYKPRVHVENTPLYGFDLAGSQTGLLEGFRTVFEKRWAYDDSVAVDLSMWNRSSWENGGAPKT